LPQADASACGNNGITSLFTFFSRCVMLFSMETYELIRSRRRTLALEITPDCRVLVRAPMNASQASIRAFVDAHERWLRTHLEQQRQRMAAAPPPPTPADIEALKAKARAILPQKVAQWSRKTGLIPTGLKITTARKRYGSCSGKNSLCFSCFLMECPEAAIDLVVVHELCHIREKNHSPRFYALLEEILPDWKARRKLLK
jgi:predicted metal-dependent hydrolase